MVKEDADLGSSVLYISEGLKFSVVGDYYLTHGGLAIGEGVKVFYGAKTKAENCSGF